MGLTRSLNDALANAVGKTAISEDISMGQTGSRTLGPNAASSITQPSPMAVWFDEVGLVAEVGRGESDAEITYLALYSTQDGGTKCYIYPNATSNGITVSDTKP